MARERGVAEPPRDTSMSIVGAGMTFIGDCETPGALRVDGTVEGSIRAGRGVEIGPHGMVTGDVRAQSATVAGAVRGSLMVEGRLEIQATSRIEGEVYAAKVSVGDGALLNAIMRMDQADLRQAG